MKRPICYFSPLRLRVVLLFWLLIPICGRLGWASPVYLIRAEPVDSFFSGQVLKIVRTGEVRLQSFTPVDLPDTIEICIAGSQADFDRFSLGQVPDWGAATAVPVLSRIVLKSPVLKPIEKSPAEVVIHELAHLYLYHLAGKKHLPRWLDEGFAKWQSGEWSYGETFLIVRANFTNSLVPLKDIERVLSYRSGQAALAYAQSYLAVQYVIQTYGKQTFIDLVHSLATNPKIDSAFFLLLGITLAGFEKEYLDYVRRHYSVFTILGDFYLIWILVIVLFFIAVYARWRRKKKILERWRKENGGEFPTWLDQKDFTSC